MTIGVQVKTFASRRNRQVGSGQAIRVYKADESSELGNPFVPVIDAESTFAAIVGGACVAVIAGEVVIHMRAPARGIAGVGRADVIVVATDRRDDTSRRRIT